MHLEKKPDFPLTLLTNSRLEPRNLGRAMPQKQRQSLIKVILGALYLLLILALPAIAICEEFNPSSGLSFASNLFILPVASSISIYGLPLLLIVSIETFILHKREFIPYLKAFFLVAWANGFYLIASFVSYAYAFLSLFLHLSLICSLIGSLLSAAMCLSFCQRTGYLKHLNQEMFTYLVYLLFIGLGFTTSFLMVVMERSAEPAFLYMATMGLLLIGFIFGFAAKGYAIAIGLRKKRLSLAATIMSMHVSSFAMIPIALYFMQPE